MASSPLLCLRVNSLKLLTSFPFLIQTHSHVRHSQALFLPSTGWLWRAFFFLSHQLYLQLQQLPATGLSRLVDASRSCSYNLLSSTSNQPLASATHSKLSRLTDAAAAATWFLLPLSNHRHLQPERKLVASFPLRKCQQANALPDAAAPPIAFFLLSLSPSRAICKRSARRFVLSLSVTRSNPTMAVTTRRNRQSTPLQVTFFR